MTTDPDSRQSQRLSALYSTAQALTELGSVNDVLQAIAQHSHRLIGSDLVYITVDEDDERTMRAVVGTFSREFRTAHLQMGIGIASLVAETLAPAWSENYAEDRRFPHSERFDYLMDLEGIVSLLGVPLIEEGQLRGVLFAGQRSPRQFTPDEVAMLSAFASHASVSLRNARLYQQSQDAVAELTRLRSEVEATAVSLTRANDVHDRITQAVLRGGGYTEVLAYLTEAIPGDAMLWDDRENLVATSPDAEVPQVPARQNTPTERGTATARAARVRLEDGRYSIRVDVWAANERFGHLVHISTGPHLGDHDYVIERTAQVLAMLMMRARAVIDAGQRARNEIVTAILRTSDTIDADLIARAQARAIDVPSFVRAICVVPEEASDLPRIVAMLNASPDLGDHAVYGAKLGTAVGLSARGTSATAEALITTLRTEGYGSVAICIEDFDPFGRVAPQLIRLTRITQFAKALGLTQMAVDADQLAPFAMLFTTEDRSRATDFVESHLGAVLRYDEKHGTALQETIAVYYRNDAHLRRTADGLFVHQNTLVKRLARVDQLLGDSWRHAPRSTLIALACQIFELTGL